MQRLQPVVLQSAADEGRLPVRACGAFAAAGASISQGGELPLAVRSRRGLAWCDLVGQSYHGGRGYCGRWEGSSARRLGHAPTLRRPPGKLPPALTAPAWIPFSSPVSPTPSFRAPPTPVRTSLQAASSSRRRRLHRAPQIALCIVTQPQRPSSRRPAETPGGAHPEDAHRRPSTTPVTVAGPPRDASASHAAAARLDTNSSYESTRDRPTVQQQPAFPPEPHAAP